MSAVLNTEVPSRQCTGQLVVTSTTRSATHQQRPTSSSTRVHGRDIHSLTGAVDASSSGISTTSRGRGGRGARSRNEEKMKGSTCFNLRPERQRDSRRSPSNDSRRRNPTPPSSETSQHFSPTLIVTKRCRCDRVTPGLFQLSLQTNSQGIFICRGPIVAQCDQRHLYF